MDFDCLGDGFISDSKSARSAEKFRYAVRDFATTSKHTSTAKSLESKISIGGARKTYPYLPALVKCTDETLFTGEMKFNDALRRIRQFLNEDYDP